MNPPEALTASPAIEAVGEHIHRLELPLPLDGLDIVNCYVIIGNDEVTLVDPGWSSSAGEHALVAGLRALGADRADVRRTLVTHAHPDHFTLAAKWQQEAGIPLHLGSLEKPSVLALNQATSRFPRQATLLELAGAPALAARIRDLELLDYERDMAWAPADVWLEDQQIIDCGGVSIRAHSVPGHTRGHVVYEDLATGALFTGDHVLPRVTPAIGLELEPEPSPLANYLTSLQVLLDRPDAAMLPAHGPVSPSVHERSRELLEHHHHRFVAVRTEVSKGPRTAYDVATAMRWTRREQPLSNLDPVHQMTAIVETMYHLDVLASRGELTRAPRGDVMEYDIT